MNLDDKLIYVITKALLRAIGMCPQDKSRLVPLQRMLIILLTSSHLCMQYLVFLTSPYSLTLYIRVLSFACPSSAIIVAYIAIILNFSAVINLDNLLKEDWRTLRNKMENAILQNNMYDNQIYLILLLCYCVSIIVITTCVQFFPAFLDLFLPLDEPRQRTLFILVEYFVSQNKYFYTVVLHELMFMYVTVIVFYAVTAQVLQFMFHIFGMLKIARYQIQSTFENTISRVSQPRQQNLAIWKGIRLAVIAHRRALKISNIMETSFNEIFCCVIVFVAMSLSINLYGIVEVVMVSRNVENGLLCVAIVLGVMSYLVLMMDVMQKIHDCNSEFFMGIYNTSWYLLPISSQKLILYLLQKSVKNYHLRFGYLFEGKLENVATVVNASLSYVCMMYTCAYS